MPTSGTIAEIGNTKLTAQEVVLAMQRIMQSGQLPAEMVDVYTPQIVDEMVQQRAIAYEFGRQGLTVSDDEVLVGLETVSPQYFKDGALIAKDEYEQRLAAQGMTLQDVVDDMRRQRMLVKVKNIVYASVLVTDKEVEDRVQARERARGHQVHRVSAGQIPRPGDGVRLPNCTRFLKGIMRSISPRKSARSRC